MTEANDEQLKRKFPFDQYGRYALIRDIINLNRGEAQKFRILDVGGRGNIMREFLLDDDVFYLDPHLETDDANYIDGDGCHIPVEDGGFDFVVSADVFEHIEPSQRNDFLMENLRAAKLGVILTAPFYSPATLRAEVLANENFKIIFGGGDHTWLKEHMENVLPQSQEVEEFFNSNGYSFQKIPNNSLLLWELLICSNFITGGTTEESRDFNYFYNDKIYPYDHEDDSYRNVYFVKKDSQLKDLNLSEGRIDDSLQLEATRSNFRTLSYTYARHIAHIDHLETENRQQSREIQTLEHELHETLRDVARIRSTFSWKITTPLRAMRVLATKSMARVKERSSG